MPWAPDFLLVLNVREFELRDCEPMLRGSGWYLGEEFRVTEGNTTVAFLCDDDEDPFGDYDPFTAPDPRHEYMINFDDPQLLPKVLKVVR
jgi:hypothetical protein